MSAIVINPAPSDPPLYVETLTARGTKRRAAEVTRILAELGVAERNRITVAATQAAMSGWPDGPVAAPPPLPQLTRSFAKLATVRERMLTEFKSLGAGA